MVIKCADIGHLAADHNTHKRWSYKLEEEFFRQVQQPNLPDMYFTKKLRLLCVAQCPSIGKYCTQQYICAFWMQYTLASAKPN